MSSQLTRKEILESINAISLNVQNTLSSDEVKAATEIFLRDLKPGRGLKGNKAEEEKFHEGKKRIIPRYLNKATSGAEEVSDVKEEPNAEHDDGDSDGGVSDIDNVDASDLLYIPSNTLPDTAEEEYSEESMVEDEDEDEDDADDNLGDKYITLNDRPVGMWDYLGYSHTEHINDLYGIEPIRHPANMTYKLWDYQLKIIAQTLFSLNGPFRGFLNGSERGLGKTIEAIVTMFIYRGEPGMCIVEGHGIKAFHLNDGNMSAHEIQALGYDVIVVSYNFLEMNARKMDSFAGKLALYANDPTASKPKRPTSAMHTSIWKELGLETKLLVLDEAQLINKPALSWAKAVARINAKRTLMLSGTLPHNTWTNMFGYVKLLKGHPFTTPREFMRVFGVPSERNTTRSKLRCLSRFLQGVTIAHPASILRLPGIEVFRVSFYLHNTEALAVTDLVYEYKKAVIGSKEHIIDGGESKDLGLFTYAIQAQVKSAHPMLAEELDARIARLDDAKFRIFSGEDVEDVDFEDRRQWIERVKARPSITKESGRVTKIVELYRYLTSRYPERKIVIFSCFLKFLDILDEALSRDCGIKTFRYDGSIAADKRVAIETAFEQAPPYLPLLITGGSGGVGLNIAYASIVIQAEPWWNANTEKQAAGRAYRQGQKHEVMVFKMFGANSDIDAEVLTVAEKKVTINRDLMKVLVTTHTEPPRFEELMVYPPVAAVPFPETEGGNRF
ncbi:hypothetical protein EAF04_000904 [Stromatinia cepivora]|nr:hypothetical protein EAF04_000904 [Stromatinia cepivora]